MHTMSFLDELFGLRGRVALVTGASSGIGAAAARTLAKAGADVALLARRADRLNAQAEELRALGVRALALPADITDDVQLEQAVQAAEAQLGPIDIVFNAAGLSRPGRAERHKRKHWDDVLAINLTSAFRLSQLVGARMIERGQGGRIIHVSSIMGRGASPVHRTSGYVASKAGVDNLTRQLAVEWAPHRITVNAIAPGYFPTEMTVDPESGEVEEEARKRIEQLTPLGRLGQLDELRTALLFLASPASSYVTGVILPVDGGWTAW
jgi:NAD(P)-dependent dehydrogenase (short-subunit alcohol dehydrogenase family)